MANVIIGIHGLGNKPPKNTLEMWWESAMLEGLKNSGRRRTVFPKFEMVYWADILYDHPLNEKEKDPKNHWYLEEKYIKSREIFDRVNHTRRRKIIEFLGKQLNKLLLSEDFTLNYAYITDAIVKKYFKDLEIYYKEVCTTENTSLGKVKDVIRQRLVDTLEKYKRDNIMLIGHSMGSIIAFDVLTFLSPHISVDNFISLGSPLGLPVVVSKIAAEQKQRLNGENHMVTPPGIFGHWYNFSDILDKVAFNFRLSDDYDRNKNGVAPIDFDVVNNYEIQDSRNPHKSFGYLRTSEFAIVLDDFIRQEKLRVGQKISRKAQSVIDTLLMQIRRQRERISDRERKAG